MRPLVATALACACLAFAWPAPARADGPATDVQAHEAYERGTIAFRRKDYPNAAREYATADALSPNPVALQAAIDAAVLADDPVLGVQLLDRARGAPRTNALLATMLAAEQKFARRTGRIRIGCPAAPCLATIDGAAIDPSQATIVRVGSHSVLVQGGGAATSHTVIVGPDETQVVGDGAAAASAGSAPAPASGPESAPASVSAPAPAPAPAPASARGLSPVWFFVGAGATALSGGLTIASGVDTASKHSSFPHCTPNCPGASTTGQAAQTRTNVGVAITAVLGVATVVLIPLVRWHAVQATVGLGTVAFDGRF